MTDYVYDQNWNPIDQSTLSDWDYEIHGYQSPAEYQSYLNQAPPVGSSYGGALTNTNKVLSQLGAQYGLTNADWNKAMLAYLHRYGATANDQNWWGDNAYTSAYLEGLGLSNPAYAGKFDSYLTNPNFRAAQESQQQNAASTGMAHQVQPTDFMDTLGPLLMLGMGGGALLGGLGALGGGAAEAAGGLGSLGSGTFGLDLGAGAAGNLGSLGIGATGTGAVASGGGALGSGLAGLGAADLGSLGGLAGGAAAGGVGSFVPEAAAGGTGSGAGGNVDWLDEILNFDTGGATPSASGDPLSGLFDTTGAGTPGGQVTGDTGSDWSVNGANPGSGSVMNGGSNTSLWDSIKGNLSNLPPGTQKAIQAMVSGGSGTGTTGGGSSLSNILGGNGSTSDWLSMLGNLGTGALSAYSANKYADNMKALADRSWQAGDDYRNRLWSSYNDPNAFLANSPDIQASVNQGTNALARSLSTQGNPTGNGHALQELQNYATQGLYGHLGNARQQLANFGGLSAITGSAPQAAANSAEAGSNIYNSLANTTSRLTQPATDWQSIMKSFGNQNYLP